MPCEAGVGCTGLLSDRSNKSFSRIGPLSLFVAWSVLQRYPNSIFFMGLEADLHACQRDVKTAARISDRMEDQIGDLKALEWVICCVSFCLFVCRSVCMFVFQSYVSL